eukprot:TRINITY_DN2257_c0_g3_i2.p1 TRINITY_DN2257_c0_g3~~TRINITY_DN2257_c0_g3_i2.p1  ORF type:complete len:1156 (-),score=187.26 TRINITY_DN2257_c0_g3_i2:70-3537(-)
MCIRDRFTEILGLPAPTRGAAFCGFDDESLADLLVIGKNEHYSTFKDLQDLCPRRGATIAAAASKEFKRAMHLVCPNNSRLAFEALRSSSAWQSEWCVDTDAVDLAHLPFVAGMVAAYQQAPKEAQLAILSLFAPYFPMRFTSELFHVSRRAVTAARLHDANAMTGQQLRTSTYERMRLSPQTFAFLHQWNRSSFAVTAGDASSNNYVRLEIRERLYDRYKVMAEQELGVKPVSRDCFNRSMKDGFADETVDTCCCGGCCDGWAALSMVQDFASDPQYNFKEWKQLVKRVEAIQEFLKGDYRWKHLQESSVEAMHCMRHALGSESCPRLRETCEHTHMNTCLECNMLPSLFHDLRNHTHDWAAQKLRLLVTPSAPEQIEEVVVLEQSMLAHLDMLQGEIHRYQAHLVRKHKASQGQMDLLSQITATRVLTFIDYKQKVLPAENKEAQSKTFGKKGKSLFGMVNMFHMPEDFAGELPEGVDMDGDYAISYFRACADDADQDFAHSVQCFEIGCKFLKKNYPWLEELMLYSDGAGNFRSLSFQFAMVEAAATAGLRVVCHLLPEAGDGKDRVDRDFAGINKLFWSYLKQPNASMQNAVEMATALEYGRKLGDGVVNCALEIQRSEKKLVGVNTEAFTKLVGKARDNMYYTKFEYKRGEDGISALSGARFYAYYEMGTGVLLGTGELKLLWPNQARIPQARIVYGSTLDDASPQLKPKVEKSRANKKAATVAKQQIKRQKSERTESLACEAEAVIEARRFSKLCPMCDRRLLSNRGLKTHMLVCKQRGVVTTEMKKAEALRSNRFGTLEGCAVALTVPTDFPIPQEQTYNVILEQLNSYRLSWRSKCRSLRTDAYTVACAVVPLTGWATKESCRRPSVTFSSDVVVVLRQCFDAVPRLNNYQIQQHLKKKFQLGTKVLRISQISGWVTSEVNRRKKAALAAVADAANMAAEAMAKGSTADLKLDDVLQAHKVKILSTDDNEDAATNLALNAGWLFDCTQMTECQLALWKYNWRQRRPPMPGPCDDSVTRTRPRVAPTKKKGAATPPTAPHKRKFTPPVPAKLVRERVESTLQPGHVQCWHCSCSVEESTYDHRSQRCSDIGACDLRVTTQVSKKRVRTANHKYSCCLLYTSDAADEEDSVDLGGRRIIKKKKKNRTKK